MYVSNTKSYYILDCTESATQTVNKLILRRPKVDEKPHIEVRRVNI